MSSDPSARNAAIRQLRWPVLLTRFGMIAERVTHSFWPFWSILFLAVAALLLGLHELLPLEAVWAVAVFLVFGAMAALVWGIWRFRLPKPQEAVERLDHTLPGRPIAALSDDQVIGASDEASRAVWQAHVARMAEKAKLARAVEPNLKISNRDPFALRYVAVLALSIALLFGSFWRVTSVADIATGLGSDAIATGPAWEGWIEPPSYTGKPSLYLNDISGGSFDVPEASRVTIQLYGEVGALTIAETVSGRTEDITAASEEAQSFEIIQSGELTISGDGGSSWQINVIEDQLPEIEVLAEPDRGLGGEMRQPFLAKDDYGVIAGRVEITP